MVTIRKTLLGFEIIDSNGQGLKEANDFLHMIEARGCSQHTIRAYGYDLVTLYRWLRETEDKEIQQLCAKDLLGFLTAQKEMSPRSINRRLVTIYSFYRFCVGQELVGLSGSPYYKGRGRDRELGLQLLPSRSHTRLRVKVPRTIIEPLTPTQVTLFLSTLSRYRDLSIAYLMLLCGLRSQEVRDLSLQDVNFVEQQIRVRGKGNKERMLPLPHVVSQTLEHYLHFERPPQSQSSPLFVILQGKRKGYPMTAEGLRSLFRQRRKKSELSNANPHRTRHTFGADMARAGISMPILQRLMGHQDLRTTLHYVNLSTADIAREFLLATQTLHKRYSEKE